MTDHRSLITDCRSLITDCRSLITDCRSLITATLCLLAAASAWAAEGPGGVGGCSCWLSAKDLPRGPLAAWPDQSGSGSDFKQDDATKQPAVVENEKTKVKGVKFFGEQIMSNGKNRLGDQTGLNVVPEEQFHVYMLVMVFACDHNGTLLQRGGKDLRKRTFHVMFHGDEKFYEKFYVNNRGRKEPLSGFAFGQPCLFGLRWDGAQLTASINGKGKKLSLGKESIEEQDHVLLGSAGSPTSSVNGLIFELIVFDHALSPEEVAKVREYIKTTYAALEIPGI